MMAAQMRTRVPQWTGFLVLIAGTYYLARVLGIAAIDWGSGTKDFLEYAGRYRTITPSLLPSYVGQMVVTIAMGFVGTFIALFFGVLLTPYASRRVGYSGWITWPMRSIFSFLRATPDPIFAILILMWIGVGPHGGALALALHSLGFVGKSLVDTLDRMPEDAWRGVRASGASRLQAYHYAGLPLVLPEIGSLALYTFDRNVRTATILGILGSGGIGLALKTSMDTFHYEEAATALFVIAIFVLILEVLSEQIRRRITVGTNS